MKDSELRGIVLQKFYDARHEVEWFAFEALSTDRMIERAQLANICEQLGQHGLITWKALKELHGTVTGMGKITAQGVDVVEGTAKAPITVVLHDHSISVTASSHVQVGSGNVQGVNIDVGKLMIGIDQSSVSDAEKREAKSLLEKVISNKTLWTVLGALLAPGSAQ